MSQFHFNRAVKEVAGNYHENYALNVFELPLHQKKLLLSYVLEDYEYEAAIRCADVLDELFHEKAKGLQKKIDLALSEIEVDHLKESGLVCRPDKDTGEARWYI